MSNCSEPAVRPEWVPTPPFTAWLYWWARFGLSLSAAECTVLEPQDPRTSQGPARKASSQPVVL